MRIVKIEELSSTNVYAAERLAEHPEEFTAYVAGRQPQGKGQKGSSWESEAGRNLTFSLLLRPTFLPIARQYILSKVVCLALVDLLDEWLNEVKVKWPNDIYVGNQKICGILIENQIRGASLHSSIVGVGLNVNQQVFRSDAPNPVSLSQLTGRSFNLDELLQKLLLRIEQYYLQLPDEQAVVRIDTQFEARMFRLGEWHPFIDENGSFEGKILGVNAIGQLRVLHRGANREEVYHFKEISYQGMHKNH